ncbi:hypothetical protein AOLI_G00081930 [Acnodon oligacanthus]
MKARNSLFRDTERESVSVNIILKGWTFALCLEQVIFTSGQKWPLKSFHCRVIHCLQEELLEANMHHLSSFQVHSLTTVYEKPLNSEYIICVVFSIWYLLR